MHLIKIALAITLLLTTHTHAAQREPLMHSTLTISDTPKNLLSNKLGRQIAATNLVAKIEIWQSPYHISFNPYRDAHITLIGTQNAVQSMTKTLDEQARDAWGNDDVNIFFDALCCCCIFRRKSPKIAHTYYIPSQEAFAAALSKYNER